jgi:4-azaleucine resistance transporter AzlC
VIILEKQNSYKAAYKAAFPHTLPVMTGYLFIGIAFGVMFADKGYNFLWAGLMSLLVYAGSGQYLAVNFFEPSVSLFQVVFLTFMVNVRHIFYGLSLLDKFKVSGKKKPYMIFSLTDETYSLYFLTKTPPDVDEGKFLFALSTLDQSYWIIGSMIGAVAGTLIPFDSTGIDFAMTALFVTVFVEQWLGTRQHSPAIIGISISSLCLVFFGQENFLIPTLLLITLSLTLLRRKLEKEAENHES